MKLINCADLMNGMILAKDITDPEGRLILAAGSVINSMHREMFKVKNIAKINVTIESYEQAILERTISDNTVDITDGAVPPDTAIIQERLLRLARMFEEHKSDPLMRELCRLSIRCAQEGLIRA